jgi:hypothetical protein
VIGKTALDHDLPALAGSDISDVMQAAASSVREARDVAGAKEAWFHAITELTVLTDDPAIKGKVPRYSIQFRIFQPEDKEVSGLTAVTITCACISNNLHTTKSTAHSKSDVLENCKHHRPGVLPCKK